MAILSYQNQLRNQRFSGKPTPQASRSPSQHDRDRILHSDALRRLANVTQVVDPEEGVVFHSRLTHTLKVAQIARRLAEKMQYEQPQAAADMGIDPEVVEAAALAHDLGHPPFGHAAETELDDLVRQQGLPDGYEGNPQSFRILTRLAARETTIPGLDLTRATLNAVLKYPRYRALEGSGSHKWGAYSTEQNIFDWTRKYSSEGDLRSVEAELMDWADDIAFSVHDVEDFFRAGLIPMEILANDISTKNSELVQLIEEVRIRWQKDKKDNPELAAIPPAVTFMEIAKELLPIFPFQRRFRYTQHDLASLRMGVTALIDRYIDAISLNPQPANKITQRTVKIDDNVGMEVRLLKGLTWRYVIHNRALATNQYGKKRIIRELFDIFFKALKAKDGEVKYILPEDYEQQLEAIRITLSETNDQKKEQQAQARLTADIISSMTDHQALSIHRRLTGIDSAPVLGQLY